MTPNTFVSAATKTGARHTKQNRPNEDSYHWSAPPGSPLTIAAISDGAGSATRARDASQIAVATAVRHAAAQLRRGADPKDAAIAAVDRVHLALHRVASRTELQDISQFHCTLILAIWLRESLTAIQIGDGAATIRTAGEHKMLTVPQQGMYANETYFVTMPQYEQIAFVNHTDAADALLMFTDGVQRHALDFASKKPKPEFANSILRKAHHLRQSPYPPIRQSFSWQTAQPDDHENPFQNWFSRQSDYLDQDDATIIVIERTPHAP